MSAIKTNGAEVKAFWNSDDLRFWPVGSFVDDMEWLVNGDHTEDVEPSTLKDTDKVTVSGVIVDDEQETKDFGTVMRRWRNEQDLETVVVQFQKKRRVEVMDGLTKLSVRVLK